MTYSRPRTAGGNWQDSGAVHSGPGHSGAGHSGAGHSGAGLGLPEAGFRTERGGGSGITVSLTLGSGASVLMSFNFFFTASLLFFEL